ncbi:MAG: hypothetical protein HGA31_05860 [Candidatus Moranbacteria bacterium]|nr:hypothetical protein [Candidatus Moranbacteria bacterium]
MTGKRFNLLGLSFTDDVTGNKVPFSVKSDTAAVPAFDKNNVKLNDRAFAFASAPLRFGKDEKVNADVVLANPSTEPRSVSVTWTLSNWSGERDENQVDQKQETITLAPNESKTLRYVANPDKSTGFRNFSQGGSKIRGCEIDSRHPVHPGRIRRGPTQLSRSLEISGQGR